VLREMASGWNEEVAVRGLVAPHEAGAPAHRVPLAINNRAERLAASAHFVNKKAIPPF